MKITKNRLQEIILEEMKILNEDPRLSGRPEELSSGEHLPDTSQEQEGSIQKRLSDIMDRMRRTLSTQLQTIDDPNEVIPFVVELLELLRELNPDLTNSEMDRVIMMLRTKTLPDAQRGLKQGT
jgi:hypothetical protein